LSLNAKLHHHAIVPVIFAAITVSVTSAHAACTPVSGDNVTATCTGTTADQDGANGYGTGAANNLATTVVSGATVTGTSAGIAFDTGSVTNAGTVMGGAYGVYTNHGGTVTNSGTIAVGASGAAGIFLTPFGPGTITVDNTGTIAGGGFGGIISYGSIVATNSGAITGGTYGVGAAGAVTVANSGAITASGFGIFAGATATVTNSGTIVGTYGIVGNIDARVANSGTITAVGYGIAASQGAVTVINSGTITATNGYGILAGTDATVTNSGAVTGSDVGVRASRGVTVANSGTITGTNAYGIFASTDASVTNSGTITGRFSGIAANSNATVTNSGVIAGVNYGIQTFKSSDAETKSGAVSSSSAVINSGIIAANGTTGIGISVAGTGSITNSGTIIGGSGTAIAFNAGGLAVGGLGAGGAPGADTLTILPGARFGGLVDFGGGADKVAFGAGSWIINTANFDKALSTVTTPGNPYFVTPNQIVVADVSGFGQQNRAIMDITGWINSVLPDAPVFAPGVGGGTNSFAAVDTASSSFEAFASVPQDALGYAATKAPVFKAASVTYADGSAVWAKGFGGQRQQDSNGAVFGGTTTGYGGAVGYERVLSPDLKIGALVGGSSNTTHLYQGAGSSSTDTVFGGGYGRKTWGATFLDLAVIGGNLDNRNARTINGGLAVQTATASYGGWFVDPSLTLGRRIDIDGRGFTVTPAIKARYVAAHFDGYTETGSTANLTVAGRDFQAWEERAELTFANSTMMANGSRVTARVAGGILGQQRSSGGLVNIALLGQSFLAATPDRASIAGGYGSAGIDWQMGRVTLFAAGEATYSNDVARSYAGKGGVRVGW